MCLQDLRISRHIKTRVITLPAQIGSFSAIPPNPDRYGISCFSSGGSYFVVLNDAGVLIPIPQLYVNIGAGLGPLYTDLRLFPGLAGAPLWLANPTSPSGFQVIEQYYDRELSELVQGDI